MAGVSPLVRLTSNDQNQIKRVMDAGALVIVPMVNSPEDAHKALEAVNILLLGNEVLVWLAPKYSSGFDSYKKWLKELIIIVQIEHIDAVNNLEAIFAVDNVDAFIIGPYDLSASMGIPGDYHLKFIDAMKRIRVWPKI